MVSYGSIYGTETDSQEGVSTIIWCKFTKRYSVNSACHPHTCFLVCVVLYLRPASCSINLLTSAPRPGPAAAFKVSGESVM